jgi:hypothetical protein
MASDSFNALLQEALSLCSRTGQITVESMAGEIRYIHTQVDSSSHPILQQDEIDGHDAFRGTLRNGFDDNWFSMKYQ